MDGNKPPHKIHAPTHSRQYPRTHKMHLPIVEIPPAAPDGAQRPAVASLRPSHSAEPRRICMHEQGEREGRKGREWEQEHSL
jgi:hypothetical protein